MELWGHQKLAIEKSRDAIGYALFFEMGTGKTGTLINILREKFNRDKKVFKTLIFTPPMVVPQFREEFFKFSKIDPSLVIALQGSGAQRIKTFNSLSSSPRIFITNYEALLMKDLFSAFKYWAPEILVFDESQRIKSISSSRSKLANELANPYDKVKKTKLPKPYTYILSGTPILNSPLDIFQQFKVMLGGFPVFRGGQQYLVDNFYEFRALYFTDLNRNMPAHIKFPNWQIKTLKRDGVDGLEKISEVINSFGMRVEKKDCLDLPEEISVTLKVTMTKEQRKAYDELKRDLVTYVNTSACVAKLAIVKGLRLQQITSGFISAENEENNEKHNIVFEKTPKEALLKELLEEITPNEKVIVWACFRENYKTIRGVCEDLNIKYVEIHGDVSDSLKKQSATRFQNEEDVRVLIGHPGSGGVGLNLTSASYSIFFSRNFSLEHFLQARARNYRGGQTKKVTHYDLVCENTIDELVLESLARKNGVSEKIFMNLVKDLERQY